VRAGYDVGAIDGFLGLKTRQAVKTIQVKFNLPADSYPTTELLARMRGGH
jgi:peptidoglycan hydrolase-like protein with peptidoglycan-binding domain